MSHKDDNGHNWQGHACINCHINAWTEKAKWPCAANPTPPAPPPPCAICGEPAMNGIVMERGELQLCDDCYNELRLSFS